jgi:site-specific recombinase XerD
MLDAMELRGYAERTRETYLHWIIELARHTHASPDQLGAADLEAFLLYLRRARGLSYSTCHQALHALRFFWREVLQRPDEVVHLPYPRVPQRQPELLSRDEVRRLIEAAGNPRDRVALMTTYAAGLRVSELCHLRVADIDSIRMALRIEQGKGQRDRYSLLPPSLLAALRQYWRDYRPKTWLFPQRHVDRPVDTGQAQKWFYAAKRRAGITKRTGIHGLRHAFASHLLEAGVDVRTLQALMGHRALGTTMRYLHPAKIGHLSTQSPLNLLDGLGR